MRKSVSILFIIVSALAGPAAAQEPAGIIAYDYCQLYSWDDGFVCGVYLVAGAGSTYVGDGTDPAWSPDGLKLAFSAGELYVMGTDESDVVQLTRGIGFVGEPACSPDGQAIAFDCEIDAGNRDICAVHADGTGLIRLTTDPAWDSGAAFSPDGLKIAFATAPLSSAVGDTWTSIGPEGGTVHALAIDPSNPAILYAGTAGGGIFKSTDGGGHWIAANTGLDYWSDAVRSLSVTSVNGGGSWSAVNTGLTNKDIVALAVDPQTPTTLYAVAFLHAGNLPDGVFKSTDAGGSWSAFNSGMTVLNVRTLAIDPLIPTTVYASTAGGGVFVATGGTGTVNVPPTASSTSMCSGFTCTLDGSGSSDPDGTITSYAWNFGDGWPGSGPMVTHTYSAGGAYAVTLTVTDNGGATSAHTATVAVGQSAMHVGDLDSTSASQQNTWAASVTIVIHDSSHGPVANATATGSWNDGSSGSCTTNASGQCGVSKAGIHKKTSTERFTIATVTRAGLVYLLADNHDPDGDSNGSTVTVTR